MRRLAVVLCMVFVTTFSLSAAQKYVITGTGQGPGSTSFAAAIPAAGGTVVRNMERIGIVVATSDNPNFVGTMSAAGGVKFVTPDMEVSWINGEQSAVAASDVQADGLNSEPFFGFQWNIRQIHADQAAANGNLGAGAIVAVLDAGCNMVHTDIAPNILSSFAVSFVPGEGVQTTHAGFNHGTHVSGIIAAAINNIGTQGVAPKAKVIPVKVLSEVTGSGSFGGIIAGIDYVSNLNFSNATHVDVINMSLGATFDRINQGGGGAGPLIAALNRAMNEASAAGILCISAAGNEAVDLNSRLWSIPAQSGNGIAVSATGPIDLANFDRLASYSNYGRSVITVAGPGGDAVDLAGFPFDLVLAPGTGVGNGYFFAAGTSMATPAVSGVAALIVGKYGHMSPDQLKARLLQSAVNIGSQQFFGRGRVDALAATSAP